MAYPKGKTITKVNIMQKFETITIDKIDLENKVKLMYKEVALNPNGNFHFELGRKLALKLGYQEQILNKVPKESIDSFAGVGYHFDMAKIQSGEIILDLGSGSGMDMFYASILTGISGKVYGIDMTKEQLDISNYLKNLFSFDNVEIIEGHLESLPFQDNSIDVIISNGVINLSPNKETVFKEIARVLKPGGRLVFSDITSEKQLSENIVCNVNLWASCIGGASQIDNLMENMEKFGLFVKSQKFNKQYEFLSSSAQGASKSYGVYSNSFLAVKD
jgi:ubiquinone/menaquinone biosynthesis C-methylase UbiE